MAIPSKQQLFVILYNLFFSRLKEEDKEPRIDVDRIRHTFLSIMLIGTPFFSTDEMIEQEMTDMNHMIEDADARLGDEVEIGELLLQEYPNSRHPYFHLFHLYNFYEQPIRAHAIRDAGLEKFPDFTLLKVLSALYAIAHENKPDTCIAWLNNAYYIEEAFPEQEEFALCEFVMFLSTLAKYFVETNDMHSALLIANELFDLAIEGDPNARLAIDLVINGLQELEEERPKQWKREG